ncbi:hypothetical protein LA76x_2169 [Lysobacter antibioticus]|uniref:Uncharacterized protein n=1 Tax=Lysobacter antibioticus TaxID=84531 RepID=A0A0S2F9Y5_LYSAN|nr:hypothetical protein LA76x_2169 [Lysobacter antibioticus]
MRSWIVRSRAECARQRRSHHSRRSALGQRGAGTVPPGGYPLPAQR